MRESRTYGSVRGACSNGRPYRDPQSVIRLRKRTASVILLDSPITTPESEVSDEVAAGAAIGGEFIR